MSFTFLNQLPSPAEIKRDFPLSEELKQLKKERDAMISDVITGKDDRFLVIIGSSFRVFIQISRVLPARAIRVSPPSRIRKKRLT